MTAWDHLHVDDVELYFGFRDEEAYAAAVDDLVADRVASGLAGGVLPAGSRALVAEIEALRAELAGRGLTRVVLCGTDGSTLGPAVICEAAEVDLAVLDETRSAAVRAALDGDLASTVVVVSAEAGDTVALDGLRRTVEQALTDAGLDAAEHLVVVTASGSTLEEWADRTGLRVFATDPRVEGVGGVESPLSAGALVPSGLAGADLGSLLDQAESARAALAADDADNPGLRLGALLGTAYRHGVDTVALADSGSPYPGLGAWIEPLLAGSTSAVGRGILPVLVEAVDAPNYSPSSDDEVLVSYGPVFDWEVVPSSGWGAFVSAPLGAQLLLWSHAAAVAGRILRADRGDRADPLDPVEQADLGSVEAAALAVLDGTTETPKPAFVAGGVEVHAGDWLPGDVATVGQAVDALLAGLDPTHGHVAVQAFVDRDAALAGVRRSLAARTGRPVTFSWGPASRLATGPRPDGVVLQLTADTDDDLGIPGRPFSLHSLRTAQAVGDGRALADRGRPVLRLHAASPEALATVVTELG